MKRLALAFVVVCGCTCELGDPPPSTDTPPIPPGCGRLALPTCWDDCCTASSSPSVDPSTCEATCPRGTRAFFDACVDEPWCFDGGAPPDFGCLPDTWAPPPTCTGGPCCGRMMPADFDWSACTNVCPEGFAFECTPDPAVCAGDFRICEQPSECMVTPNSCCGECGEPSLEGSTAVNRTDESAFRELLCADADGCPDCVSGVNPDLIATCNAARCAAVDLSRLPLAACSTDDDCILRTHECCECGASTAPGSLVALRADGIFDFLGLVCDTDAACDACVPTYPEDVTAGCVGGRCEVVFAADAGG